MPTQVQEGAFLREHAQAQAQRISDAAEGLLLGKVARRVRAVVGKLAQRFLEELQEKEGEDHYRTIEAAVMYSPVPGTGDRLSQIAAALVVYKMYEALGATSEGESIPPARKVNRLSQELLESIKKSTTQIFRPPQRNPLQPPQTEDIAGGRALPGGDTGEKYLSKARKEPVSGERTDIHGRRMAFQQGHRVPSPAHQMDEHFTEYAPRQPKYTGRRLDKLGRHIRYQEGHHVPFATGAPSEQLANREFRVKQMEGSDAPAKPEKLKPVEPPKQEAPQPAQAIKPPVQPPTLPPSKLAITPKSQGETRLPNLHVSTSPEDFELDPDETAETLREIEAQQAQGVEDEPEFPAMPPQEAGELAYLCWFVMKRIEEEMKPTKWYTVDPVLAKKYKQTVSNILHRLPEKAADMLAGNTGDYQFYNTSQDVRNALAVSHWLAEDEEGARALQNSTALAAYTFSVDKHYGKGDLFLDGGDARYATEEVYAHEFSHAIDGPDHEYSRSPEWQGIFGEEIDNAHALLGMYAKTKPSEGWAEFGRLIYSGKVPLERVESVFPKASAHWKGLGLWPTNK